MTALADVFPSPLSDWEKLDESIGDHLELTGYLVYLNDYGYIVGDIKFTPYETNYPWHLDLPTIRITASGLDHLEQLDNEEKATSSGSGLIRRERRY